MSTSTCFLKMRCFAISAFFMPLLLTTSSGQEPLYQQPRFDQILLTEEHGGEPFRVFPLNFPDGKVPARPSGPLRVRMLLYPDRQYDVEWTDIQRVELFEDVLINEATRLVKAGKFEEAYDTLAFVWKTAPRWPGLSAATSDFLLRDASAAYVARQFDEALVVLDELLKSGRTNVARAILRVTRDAFSEHVQREDYHAARQVMAWVAQRPRLNANEQVEQWRTQLQTMADQRVASARQFADQGEYSKSLAAVRRAEAIWPDLENAAALSAEILEKYPRITVGVTRLSPTATSYHFDWAFVRDARLRSRSLFELQGYGPEGGEFNCPVGQFALDSDGRGLRLSGLAESQLALSAYEVRGLLTEYACDGAAACQPVWNRLLESVDVDASGSVQVRINRSLRRWLPLLQQPISDGVRLLGASAYIAQAKDGGAMSFLRNDAYTWQQRAQPVEIRHQTYADMASAIEALKTRNLDVIDRISPAEALRLRARQDVEVGQYLFSSLYFLVPNMSRTLPADRMFRRGILYGIDREKVLQRMLLGEKDLAGCQVLSGPFPLGIERGDPIAYAFDERIKPRAYEPALARALMAMALQNAAASQAPTDGADENPTRENVERAIVLAYPDDPMLAVGATAIARNLNLGGLACELRKLSPGEARPSDLDWDFWLIDATVQEPILDIYHMFSALGLVKPSIYIEQALEELSHASRWSDARELLSGIHELVHNELPVIPLWQITNHYAFRRNLQGLSDSAVTLYQDIESWRLKNPGR